VENGNLVGLGKLRAEPKLQLSTAETAVRKQTARHNVHWEKQWKTRKNLAEKRFYFYGGGFFRLTDETFSFSDADNFDFPAV